jgi:hypothetical protein
MPYNVSNKTSTTLSLKQQGVKNNPMGRSSRIMGYAPLDLFWSSHDYALTEKCVEVDWQHLK